MGVVRMYRCGYLVGVVVRRYIYRYLHNNYYFPYSTCISSFLASSIPTSLFIFYVYTDTKISVKSFTQKDGLYLKFINKGGKKRW